LLLGGRRAAVCALAGELLAAGRPIAVVSAAGGAGAPSLAACRRALAESHGATAADELVDRAPRSLLLRGRTGAVARAA
jgi:hypothetical protein